MRIPSPALVIAVIALLVAASGSAYAVGRATGETISACQNKKTGVLAVKKRCSPNETPISWSEVGPQGPQGAPGGAGPQGPAGAQGPAGVAGKDGSIWNPCELVQGNILYESRQGMRCSGSYRYWDINDWRTGSYSNAIYTGSDFSGADFTQTGFPTSADFSGVNFSGAILVGAGLSDSDYKSANFTGANMRNVSFGAGSYLGVNFTNADLTNANGRPTVTGAIWSNTTCPDGVVRSTACW